MGKKLLDSFLFSLEWRFWAFLITSLFLWATTGHLAFAAMQALGLQVVLLFGHSLWYYLRNEGKILTFDSLTSWVAHGIVSAFRR